MACCDKCGNFDHDEGEIGDPNYQPDLILLLAISLRGGLSDAQFGLEGKTRQINFECICEICFDILNVEKDNMERIHLMCQFN